MCKISKKISDRRKQLGLTLEDVGNAVGVSKTTVQRWESGLIKNMGRDKVAALANVLQLPAVELISEFSDFSTVRVEVPEQIKARDFLREATVKSRQSNVYGFAAPDIIPVKAEADPQFKSMMKLWEVATPKAKKSAIELLKILSEKE